MKINRNSLLFFIITLLIVLELGFLTFWRKRFDPHVLPFLYLFVQLLIGSLPIIFFKKEQVSEYTPNYKKVFQLLLGGLLLVGVYLSYGILTNQYKQIAINPAYSDIIPQIQKFCQQALSFKYPYTPFDDFGYHMTPTYLPAQWLPYLPSGWLKFDPRLITLFIFLSTFSYLSVLAIRKAIHPILSFIIMAIPVLLVSAVNDHDQGIWSVTVEMLIMSYYLLAGIGIVQNNYKLLAFALILCLMSRYSLIFWLPLYCFIVLTEKGTPFTLKLILTVITGCLLLYAPFLWVDSHIFMNAQIYYDMATVGEWTRSDKPVHLYNGLGMAIFFLEKSEDVVNNIALLKKTMIVSSLFFTLFLGLIWWRFKHKIDSSLFAISSLKISLAVFYAFIQIPYSYLYVTPFIISCVILFKLGKRT